MHYAWKMQCEILWPTPEKLRAFIRDRNTKDLLKKAVGKVDL